MQLGQLLTKHLKDDGTVLLFCPFDELKATKAHMTVPGSDLEPFKRFFTWVKTSAVPAHRSKCPNASCEALLYFKKKNNVNYTSWEGNPHQKWKFLDHHEMAACNPGERVLKHGADGTADVVRVEQKPYRYMIMLILMFTSPGDLVIDPFMGVGSTAVACALTGRRFWGCDVDAEATYFARLRLKSLREAIAAGGKRDRTAFTWEEYKKNYFSIGPRAQELADTEAAAAQAALEKEKPKENDLALTEDDVDADESSIVSRLKGQWPETPDDVKSVASSSEGPSDDAEEAPGGTASSSQRSEGGPSA
jgi:hypothetical protein